MIGRNIRQNGDRIPPCTCIEHEIVHHTLDRGEAKVELCGVGEDHRISHVRCADIGLARPSGQFARDGNVAAARVDGPADIGVKRNAILTAHGR